MRTPRHLTRHETCPTNIFSNMNKWWATPAVSSGRAPSEQDLDLKCYQPSQLDCVF